MGSVSSLLPALTVSNLLIQDLLSEDVPCFTLGNVLANGKLCGFISIRPPVPIPLHCTVDGFHFGHSVLGINGSPVLHFAFDFIGHTVLHGLVNPGNRIARTVLETMVETGRYYFLSINPDDSATCFFGNFQSEDFVGLRSNLKQYSHVSCWPAQYEKALSIFRKNPSPPGEVLSWVCRDNPDYLDLDRDPMVMNLMV